MASSFFGSTQVKQLKSVLLKLAVFFLMVAPVILLAFFDYNEASKIWDRLAVYERTAGTYYRDAFFAKPEHLNFISLVYAMIISINSLVAYYIIQYASKSETAQQKIEEEKAKDEAILESIGEGIIGADYSGRILVINRAAQEMVGWTRQEMIEKPLVDMLPLLDEHGKQVSGEDRPLQKALSTRKVYSVKKYFYVRKDKSRFPVAITVSPINLKGRHVGIIAVIRDITKEKEIDQAKSEFVSLASHQLKTPLSAVKWYCEMLLAGDGGKLNATQKEYIDGIYEIGGNMKELVDALLNVSRIELGTFMVDPKPTDIPKMAQTIIQEHVRHIKEKHLKISNVSDKDMPQIHADPKLIRVILENLISNAVKYTPDKGQVTVSSNMAKKDEDVNGSKLTDESFLIKVSDSGYGIPKDQQDKIFGKLFRADNVRIKMLEGTGLGLYIIKSLLDRVGGRISFHSEENKGTTFFVTIPASGMRKIEGTKSLA